MSLTLEERTRRQSEAKRRYGQRRTASRRSATGNASQLPTHAVIPDTQAKPGVPNDHLVWIGKYLAERKPDVIIHLGDHYDMPSLSSYDKGRKKMEGRRVKQDLLAGDRAFDLLDTPLREESKATGWSPRRVYLHGNHEDRITRAIEADAQLDGLLTLDELLPPQLGWETHGFLEPVEIDGVSYAHYFYRPNSGRNYSGAVETRLRNIGHSFTQGHEQGLLIAQRPVGKRRQRGLVAGSCYQHSEEYRGPQAQNEWRGIILKHQVEGGDYDLMEVSLDFLCRRYEGHRLTDHAGREL